MWQKSKENTGWRVTHFRAELHTFFAHGMQSQNNYNITDAGYADQRITYASSSLLSIQTTPSDKSLTIGTI